MQEYVEFFKSFIGNRTGLDAEKIDDDVNMFEAGYLDSLAVFDLFLELELRFGVRLCLEDVAERRASSISALAAVLARKADAR